MAKGRLVWQNSYGKAREINGKGKTCVSGKAREMNGKGNTRMNGKAREMNGKGNTRMAKLVWQSSREEWQKGILV